MTARLVSIAFLSVAGVCNAATIGNAAIIGTDPIPPNFTLSGFGSSQVYRGQTFRLPSGADSVANSLTVFVGPTSDSSANFRVLVTEVDRSTGFNPTNVLFESDTLNVPPLPSRPTPDEFLIDLGGISLQSEQEYAWILDHFAVGDPTDFVAMGTGLGSYLEGNAFSFPNGPFFPAGTREDHFASSNWFVQEDRDFAFQLNFDTTPDAVPEPRTGLISSLGLLSFLFARRIMHR